VLELTLGQKRPKQIVSIQDHHVIIVRLGRQCGESGFGFLLWTLLIVEPCLAGSVSQRRVWMGLVRGNIDVFVGRGAHLQKVQHLTDPARSETMHMAATWVGQI
jgi:hypothetical protein